MADSGECSSKGNVSMSEKKRKSKETYEDVCKRTLEHLASLAPPPAKQKKKSVFVFEYDCETGKKQTHCKYRPRRKATTACGSGTVVQDIEADPNECDDLASLSCDEADEFEVVCLQAENEIMEWEKKNKRPSQRKWDKRMSNVQESWNECRLVLLEKVLEQCRVPNDDELCHKCHQNKVVIRCTECAYKRLCYLCDNKLHTLFPFHDREAFANGYMKPISPTIAVDSDGKLVDIDRCFPFMNLLICHTCKSGEHLIYTVKDSFNTIVTLKGRFDLNDCSVLCHKCNTDIPAWSLSNIVKFGLWPGSITNTNTLFDQNLLIHWDLVQKQMPGTSERAFLSSLAEFSKRKGRLGVINSTAFNQSFKEWKFCQFEVDLLQSKHWMECPPCSIKQHSVHVDGNMKLYRYKSAGQRHRECYYKETFVASNAKVDVHLKRVYKNKNNASKDSEKKCGDSTWRAAGNTLKMKKSMDETGLEIAGCRHGIAQHSVNMLYGEVYGYAHYMQTTFFIPGKVQFFWYDVVCKYWPWLKKHDMSSAQQMQPALSVMHAKAHSWSCQRLWGGRWQKGACGTTGEEVEQINSHFSRLNSTTKHMRPEGN